MSMKKRQYALDICDHYQNNKSISQNISVKKFGNHKELSQSCSVKESMQCEKDTFGFQWFSKNLNKLGV